MTTTGFGIYSAMGFGNFALVGDASMTVISHEVEGLDLSGKAGTKAVTMGLTGQYTISTAAVDVTPHLGARFIRLNTDSYDLMSADGAIATTDFDVQNVFSIPLGVTLSKAFSTSGWTLAPSADLTVAFNTGDTEAKSHTQFNSTKPMAVAMNTEVLDEVQYGLTVGLGAQTVHSVPHLVSTTPALPTPTALALTHSAATCSNLDVASYLI